MLKDKKILIIDTEFSLRETLSVRFIEKGCIVDTVENSSEAIKMLKEYVWDAVLLDINIYGTDPIEMIEKIREIDKNIVIIVSSIVFAESALKFLKSGAYDYLSKPINPDYLEHILNNAFREKQLYKENMQIRENVRRLSLNDSINIADVLKHNPYLVEDISEKKDHPKTVIDESLARVEKDHIILILEKNNWNISKSAEILSIDRVTLYNKIEKYGLRK
jgi:two-component system, NtrC family, response regulator AtoC